MGTASTDALGHYAIRNVRLTVQRPSPKGWSFTLQLYATAPGLPFAWSPEFLVHTFPDPRFGDDEHFTPITKVMDFAFMPSSQLRGRILDERGQPVVGANVEIAFIDVLRQKVELEGEENLTATHFTFLEQIVPKKQRSVPTDANGRFLLDRVPRDCFTALEVTHPRFPVAMLYAATAPEPLPDLSWLAVGPKPGPQKNPVWTGDIQRLALVTPHVRSQCRRCRMSSEPVAGIARGRIIGTVRARSISSAWATTDAQGQAEYQLPARRIPVVGLGE